MQAGQAVSAAKRWAGQSPLTRWLEGSLATAESGASATIVLTDDHTVVRRGLRTLLEEAGLTIQAEAADTPHRVAHGPCL
jgi:hypothetical protein